MLGPFGGRVSLKMRCLLEGMQDQAGVLLVEVVWLVVQVARAAEVAAC